MWIASLCIRSGVEVAKQDSSGRRQLRAGGETHDSDLMRIDAPFLRVGAHQTDGLKSVVHFVGLRIVAVAAHPVPEDDGGMKVPAFAGDDLKIVIDSQIFRHRFNSTFPGTFQENRLSIPRVPGSQPEWRRVNLCAKAIIPS
jgi:hypothetical protein